MGGQAFKYNLIQWCSPRTSIQLEEIIKCIRLFYDWTNSSMDSVGHHSRCSILNPLSVSTPSFSLLPLLLSLPLVSVSLFDSTNIPNVSPHTEWLIKCDRSKKAHSYILTGSLSILRGWVGLETKPLHWDWRFWRTSTWKMVNTTQLNYEETIVMYIFLLSRLR